MEQEILPLETLYFFMELNTQLYLSITSPRQLIENHGSQIKKIENEETLFQNCPIWPIVIPYFSLCT